MQKSLEIAVQPLSASKLQDSSEEDTSFDGESSPSVSASDPSSESGEDTEDPAHPNSEWTTYGHFLMVI